MNSDGHDVWIEPVLAGARHAVLPDEDHQIGAHQSVGREVCGQAMIVREVALHRPAGGDHKVVLFRRFHQGGPALAVKHAMPGDEERPLRLLIMSTALSMSLALGTATDSDR